MEIKDFKPDAVFENKSWNGNKIMTFKKDNCCAGTLEKLFELWINRKEINNDGAANDYNGKTFNND